jgi:hypothetical protein
MHRHLGHRVLDRPEPADLAREQFSSLVEHAREERHLQTTLNIARGDDAAGPVDPKI